jgi:hypothetical protein
VLTRCCPSSSFGYHPRSPPLLFKPPSPALAEMMKIASILLALAVVKAAPVAQRQWRQLAADEKHTCVCT